jgi:hypothetical protein
MVSCPGPVLPAGHHVPLTGEGRVIAVLVNAVPPVILSRRNRGTYATGSAKIFGGVALLALVLVIGLATAGDFGFTIDEFNTDDYGPKALAWYTSGFTDRSHFETVEQWLWAYGPRFHILTAIIQSFKLADPITVRHAMTFLIGLVGVATLLPIARVTVGGWAGVVAIILCLTNCNFYGHLFFTPIDVPFMTAMTLATLAIVVMAIQLPSWPATIAVGLTTGLAMARVDLLKANQYMFGSMQISRGCPFTCEFCDIIVTFGRRPRLKTSEQVLAELESFRRIGLKIILVVDDNLIGNKKAIKPILRDIIKWQQERAYPLTLFTEASLDRRGRGANGVDGSR